jgi:FKBP-type peptidyl-prolyl cis-trans isomerase (trigger factor)
MAAPTVNTSVTELPESRVRVDAQVPPEEVEKSIAQAARALGRNLRVPGSRAGKAPPPVVIQRVGRDAVLLVYAEDMTHAAAAEIMGCREATVSWHIFEARKTLRGLL